MEVITTYPPQYFDFDQSNIPAEVLSPFTEAVVCHAHGCFTASAMLIRKTFENLCKERGANGKDLTQVPQEGGKKRNFEIFPGVFLT